MMRWRRAQAISIAYAVSEGSSAFTCDNAGHMQTSIRQTAAKAWLDNATNNEIETAACATLGTETLDVVEMALSVPIKPSVAVVKEMGTASA